MSGFRKRRSSDSLEGDRKRIPLDRYDYGSYIKQEYDNAQVNNNGRQIYSAVPYNYVASSIVPAVTSGHVQSAVVYSNPQRYGNSQYVEPYRPENERSLISSTSNYNAGYGYSDVLPSAYYDKGRQMNFNHEVYINSLRQSEPRNVNFNDLRRHLSTIDIRYVYNLNFSTALDLTVELESSLNYFVDTRNELVFLRKMQYTQCDHFSYNEINITNRNGIYNRMRFLEDESSYRSNRMNQLFHHLQRVVLPATIDDIRYVHSVSYEKAWTNRARYWFNLFKQMKWEHRLNGGDFTYTHSKHRRPYRRHALKEQVAPVDKMNFKSEADIVPKQWAFDAKIVKIEKRSNITPAPPKDTVLSKHDPIKQSDNRIQAAGSHIVEHTTSPDDIHADIPVFDNIVEPLRQGVAIETKENVEVNENVAADKESDRSNSCVIIEQNVSLVVLKDDDNNCVSNNDANPPEGDTSVNECN